MRERLVYHGLGSVDVTELVNVVIVLREDFGVEVHVEQLTPQDLVGVPALVAAVVGKDLDVVALLGFARFFAY